MKLCEEQGESFLTTYKSLLSHLKDDGFIEVVNDSNTKQLRLGNKTRRKIKGYTTLSKQAIKEYMIKRQMQAG